MLSTISSRRRNSAAFTLIELMIVVAIIAIIAAIAIPGLLRSKMSTNESSTIGSLKTIASSQVQFKGSGAVDQDNDGDGEFGLLGELAGTSPCRTHGGTGGPKLIPPVIPQGLGLLSNGSVSKAGYEYRVYLPTAAGPAMHQLAMTVANGNSANANVQENRWACYAWPAVAGNSGQRVFVVAESGEILAANNLATTYGGKGTPVPPEAAMASVGASVSSASGSSVASGGSVSTGSRPGSGDAALAAAAVSPWADAGESSPGSALASAAATFSSRARPT